MKSRLGWITAGLFALALVGVLLFSNNRWGWPYGMMQGYGMMGRGYGWFLPFGGMMMLLAMALPLIIIVGLAAALFAAFSRPAATPPPVQAACPGCARPIQSGWRVCPYCETRLLPDATQS